MAVSDGPLHVELVAPDRTVWSGAAEMVIARTTEGDVGILRGHAPLLSLLTDATVEISSVDSGVIVAVGPAAEVRARVLNLVDPGEPLRHTCHRGTGVHPDDAPGSARSDQAGGEAGGEARAH